MTLDFGKRLCAMTLGIAVCLGGHAASAQAPAPAPCAPTVTGTGKITGKIGLDSAHGQQIYNSLQAIVKPAGKGDAWALVCNDDVCTCPVIEPQKVISSYSFSSGFPKDFTITGLPDGKYKLWLVLDTEESKKRGKSFDVDKKATEFDMTTCGGVSPAAEKNPAPLKVDLTVSGGKADVGVLRWCHIYFENAAPKPAKDAAFVVIGAEDGAIRLLDLDTHKMVDANPATPKVEAFNLVEGTSPWQGKLCGMVRGAGKKIYMLGTDAKGGRVFVWDVAKKKQVGTAGALIPGGISPCRGAYYEKTGKKMLFLLNRPGTKPESVGGAMASVDITALETGGAMPYKIYDQAVDPLFNRGLAALEVVGDKLAILNENDTLVGNGKSTIYVADIAADGALTLKPGGKFVTYTAESTTGYECGGKVPVAGMRMVPFGGKPLVYVGNLASISVFDASTNPWTPLDYDAAAPGVQGLDTSLYGQVIAQFEPAPDGKTLWLMPECKSKIHFKFKLGRTGNPQTFNRHRLAVLDLTAKNRPELAAKFTNNPEFDDDTANPDPGFDFDNAYLKRYIVYNCAGCAGGTPPTIYVGPQIVVGKKSVWLRGAGLGGSQGVGQFSDIGGFDMATRQGYLFRNFNFWMQGGSAFWGYDITPDGNSPSTGWILYMPKK